MLEDVFGMKNQQGIVLVSSVSILHKGKVLIIKENKPSVQNKWNFPSGRVEYGETIMKKTIAPMIVLQRFFFGFVNRKTYMIVFT